ncbi:MAG: hypothetical protein ACYC6L_14050, partial [Anaerolineae bacterium]
MPGKGDFLWDITSLPSFSSQIRIQAQAKSGLSTVILRSVDINPSEPLTIRLFSPKGGERLRDEALILWNVPQASEKQVTIDLYFSDDAGQTWLPLAEELADTSYYQWQLSFLPPGDQYQVKAVAHSSSSNSEAISAGTFTIGALPEYTLKLINPENEAILSGYQRIDWIVTSGSHNPRSVSLECRPVGQQVWDPIVQQSTDDGFFLWNTAPYSDGVYDLRLLVYTSSSVTPLQQTIQVTLVNHSNHPPIVQVTSAQVSSDARNVLIRWDAADIDQQPLTATLQYKDVGGSWHDAATMPAQRDVYLWELDNTSPEIEARLNISDGLAETSAGFTVKPPVFYEPDLALLTDAGLIRDTGQIIWSAKDRYGQNLAVDIYLAKPDGNGRTLLASNLTSQSYNLDTSVFSPGSLYLLQLVARGPHTLERLPDIAVSITPPPFLAPRLDVELPQTAVTWTLEHEITWVTDDPLGRSLSIQVDLSGDGGFTWERVAQGAESTGSFIWDTTQYPNGLYLVRVTASSRRTSTRRTSAPIRLANRLNYHPA